MCTWTYLHVCLIFDIWWAYLFLACTWKKCFLSHDADGAIIDTIAFLLLRWLFRDIMWLFVPVLILVLALVSCAIDNAIGVTWCWCQWHHITKKVMLHLTWSMLPLVTSPASHDAKASANGITYCTPYWTCWPKECSGAIDNAIGLMWHWHWHQLHHITKKVMLQLIWIVWTERM